MMFDYVFYLIENKKGDIEIEESDMLELASDYEPQNFIGVSQNKMLMLALE